MGSEQLSLTVEKKIKLVWYWYRYRFKINLWKLKKFSKISQIQELSTPVFSSDKIMPTIFKVRMFLYLQHRIYWIPYFWTLSSISSQIKKLNRLFLITVVIYCSCGGRSLEPDLVISKLMASFRNLLHAEKLDTQGQVRQVPVPVVSVFRIQIQGVFWIRIRNPDPNPGA